MTEYLKYKNDFDSPELALVCDELSFWSSRFGRLLFEQIELRRDQAILDVGCANGFPLFELAHVFGRSCRVTGLDIWEQALLRAREKLRIYNLPNVHLVLASAARQPFADGTFDLIVSNLGLNNWSHPQGVLAECFRVSKRGARIALTTNLLGHYREFYAVFREVLRERGKPEYLERLDAQEAHRGTRETHCGLLRAAGFALVKVVEESFELRFLDAGALMNHSLTKIGFLDGWRSVVGADEEEEIFATVERKLDEEFGRRGELRLSVPALYLEAEKEA
ncbi:MAG TPA: methyltransferase domain-containing protein [Pyrinomonadaceae bacterium]